MVITAYLFLIGLTFCAFGLLRILPNLKKNIPINAFVDLKEVTVVVPFRNEKSNLPDLLISLEKQAMLPHAFIFVDDHSTDASFTYLHSFLQTSKLEGRILSLADGFGKKQALRAGIQAAKTKYVLTLDADVVLPNNYMENLASVAAYDLVSMPVQMEGTNFLGKLFAFEATLFNAFNYLLANYKATTTSGANLLLNTQALNYEEQLQAHQAIASGDDHFLLKYMQKGYKNILFLNSKELTVSTDSPSTFHEYFNQRVRWLSKSRHQTTTYEMIIGLFLFSYIFGGFISMLFCLLEQQFFLLTLLIVLRSILDFFTLNLYSRSLFKPKLYLYYCMYLLFYPLLFTTTVVLSFFYKPKWKERSVT